MNAAPWLAATDGTKDGGRDDEERFDPLAAKDCPDVLGRTARLFGTPGWRGLVRIDGLSLSGGERRRNCDSDSSGGIPGIAVDRFSGAVLDTGPFFFDAWIGVTLQFTLILEQRGGFPTCEDRDLFAGLVDYVRCQGLLLGHGVNRGFGWFDDEVKITEESL